MKIAICDDEALFLKMFHSKLENILEQYGNDSEISLYQNSTDLIRVINDFDAAFLDVDMPDVSGEDIAKQIKENNGKTLVVFVTSHDDFVFSAFRYRPFGFIRKRYIDEELSGVAADIIDYFSDLNLSFIFISNGNTLSVKFKEIFYFEAFGHDIIVHTASGDYSLTKSLSAVEKELSDKGFIRTHKSFLVNCYYIFSIEKSSVVLSDNRTVPLSRHRINEVKQKVITFSRGY